MSVLSDIQAIGASKAAHFHWAQFWRLDHQAGWYPMLGSCYCHCRANMLPIQALVLARQNNKYQDIATSTRGCIFLGTPHQGANGVLPVLGSFKAMASAPFGARGDLLKLLRDPGQLRTLDHEFHSVYGNLSCISFYECKPEYAMGLSIGPVRYIWCSNELNTSNLYRLSQRTLPQLLGK